LTAARARVYDPRRPLSGDHAHLRPSANEVHVVTAALRVLAWIPPVVVTVLMVIAMVDMLAGVFLRYVMTKVSVAFDLPTIRFFWVEEIGEYALAWLTFIGAAIGIRRGTHFAVQILTERLPRSVRRAILVGHYVLLAAFGILVAFFGWQVAELNSQSYSPALDLNLRWLYLSAVVGGALITVYSLAAVGDACRTADPRPGGH
jgi:TRAP-type C4-dicarboxylate transport system permease small subunit